MHKTNEHILFQTKHRHRHRRTKKRSYLRFFSFFTLCINTKSLCIKPKCEECSEKKTHYITKRNRKSKIINRIQCIQAYSKSKHTPKMKTKLPTHKQQTIQSLLQSLLFSFTLVAAAESNNALCIICTKKK